MKRNMWQAVHISCDCGECQGILKNNINVSLFFINSHLCSIIKTLVVFPKMVSFWNSNDYGCAGGFRCL